MRSEILILIGVVAVGCLVGWAIARWSDRKSGQVLVRLNRFWGDWAVLCTSIVCVLVVPGYAYWFLTGEDKRWAGLIGCCLIAPSAVALLLVCAKGTALRQRGILTCGGLLPWTKVSNWTWQDGDRRDIWLVLREEWQRHLGIRLWTPTHRARVPLDKKPLVEGILVEKIGKDRSGEAPQA